MNIIIKDMKSSITGIDADGFLTPEVLDKIADQVMRRMDQKQRDDTLAESERRISSGVAQEQREE